MGSSKKMLLHDCVESKYFKRYIVIDMYLLYMEKFCDETTVIGNTCLRSVLMKKRIQRVLSMYYSAGVSAFNG